MRRGGGPEPPVPVLVPENQTPAPCLCRRPVAFWSGKPHEKMWQDLTDKFIGDIVVEDPEPLDRFLGRKH
eukprot:4206850-Karenia_brevis.AAC.1